MIGITRKKSHQLVPVLMLWVYPSCHFGSVSLLSYQPMASVFDDLGDSTIHFFSPESDKLLLSTVEKWMARLENLTNCELFTKENWGNNITIYLSLKWWRKLQKSNQGCSESIFFFETPAGKIVNFLLSFPGRSILTLWVSHLVRYRCFLDGGQSELQSQSVGITSPLTETLTWLVNDIVILLFLTCLYGTKGSHTSLAVNKVQSEATIKKNKHVSAAYKSKSCLETHVLWHGMYTASLVSLKSII